MWSLRNDFAVVLSPLTVMAFRTFTTFFWEFVSEPIGVDTIRSRILTIRGVQVMLDRDLAELYGVPTKRLNEQVKRNVERFPSTFMFHLVTDEMRELVANCDRFKSMRHSSVLTLDTDKIRT